MQTFSVNNKLKFRYNVDEMSILICILNYKKIEKLAPNFDRA